MTARVVFLKAWFVMCASTLAVLGEASADQQPKAPPLSNEARTAYRGALKEGRALAAAGKTTDAIAAFRRALAAVPDDATALSELGLAAFRAKDLPLAEESARKSAVNAGTPALRGASLYNLGRVLEDKGDRPHAVEAYVASLHERPNVIVRERLAGLDPAAAAGADPFAPQPMLGPFATLADFCGRVAKPECMKPGEEPNTFKCGDKGPGVGAKKVAPPYLAARIFTSSCLFDPGEEWGEVDYHLAIKLAGGWFVAPNRFQVWANHHCDGKRTINDVVVSDAIPGGAPEVVIRSSAEGECVAGDSSEDWEREQMVVAGIGQSAKPSATPPLLRKQRETTTEIDEAGHNGPEKTRRVDLKIDFLPGDEIEISGDATGLDKSTKGALLGKHSIVFQ